MAKKINNKEATTKKEVVSETNEATAQEAPNLDEKPVRLTVNNLISSIFSGYADKATEQAKNDCNLTISKYLTQNDPPFVCHYAAKLHLGGLDLPKKVTKWTFSSSPKYSTPRSSAVPI
jgi:hypothetical protein